MPTIKESGRSGKKKLVSKAEVDTAALSAFVHVKRRFLRSVSLERDFYTTSPLSGYVPTPGAINALERVALGIRQSHDRAVSLTGAYGTGKSAFALLMTKALALLPLGDEVLRRHLSVHHPKLNGALPETSTGFWPVLITGARENFAAAVVRGLRSSLEKLERVLPEGKTLQTIQSLVGKEAAGGGSNLSGQETARLLETVSKALCKSVPGCIGLLVVVDEMGKFLEWAAHHPEAGDIQAFQEIAEAAVRSDKFPLLFVTILHQAFDEYAHRLGPVQRAEWQKVQGRFTDIPFGDTSDDTVRLIGRAIERDPDETRDTRLARLAKSQASTCNTLKIAPRSFREEDFRETIARAYPLHPVTLLVLPTVFSRFGQSERSLFSFLSSDEPHGFVDFLNSKEFGPDQAPLLRIDALYDYLVANLGHTLYSHPGTGKLWSQAQEAVYRCADRPPLDGRIVKTIAILHILGEQPRVAPSRDVLRFALTDNDISPADIDSRIKKLETATLITYRQFKKAYRPYEGSDIDVEARLREARTVFAGNVDIAITASKLAATQPMIARRHSFVTGTLRLFDVSITHAETLMASENSQPEAEFDGRLVLCLVSDSTVLSALEGHVAANYANRPEIIVAAIEESEALHEAAIAIEALLAVKENTPELRSDAVASREVEERLMDAEVAFRTEWDALLIPEDGPSASVWFHLGERVPLGSARDLQLLISRACDLAFPDTPRLRNELINRRQLSSTAAAARRNLLEGMIHQRNQPLLGIGADSYPPERAMYATMLEQTGLHRIEEGIWDFRPPIRDRDPALGRVWDAIEEYIFGGDLKRKPLDQLKARLTVPPFGLADGIIPVLLCSALLLWEDEAIVYEGDSFVTQLDAATFERMIKRPENFRIQGVRISGNRRAIIDRLAKNLLQPDENRTIVNVVRALYKNFSRLPAFALNTRNLSPRAKALRDLFKEARAPEQFLFADLPEVVGSDAIADGEADDQTVKHFFNGLNRLLTELFGAYDLLLSRVERRLYEDFGVEGMEELVSRSNSIRPFTTEPALTAFLQRTRDDTLAPVKWLESIAAVIVGRPPFAWTDDDEKKFNNALPGLASAFRNAELVAFAKSEVTQTGTEEHVGFRVAITEQSGEEDARIVVMPKREEQLVADLTERVGRAIKELMAHVPEDVQLAVISRVAQTLMRGAIK